MSSTGSEPRLFHLFVETPPEVVFHYTSMEGLLGIVQSGNIRATDSRYLNDAKDSAYLFELLKARIAKQIAESTDPGRKYCEDLLSALQEMTGPELFVASFSENGDSLSQWRAYSAAGIGFSIGFYANAFRAGTSPDQSGAERNFLDRQLLRVRYLSEGDDFHLEWILKGAKELGSLSKLNLPISPAEMAAAFVTVFGPIFKHKAFEEECEWRLVLKAIPGPIPGKRLRTGKSVLVPYVEAEPQANAGYFIKEVIVGPSPHPELSVESVKVLFRSANHPEVAVRVSNVPYRHW